MKHYFLALAMFMAFGTISCAKDDRMSIYDFNVTTISSKEISMSQYKDKVLLIVNVASDCGFTPQYKGLEDLFREYKDRGFVVLGFPSNQFGAQEPKGEEQIKRFCEERYGVTFDMFSKVDVNGDDALPLFEYLKSERSGILWSRSIKWNFTKFLVDRDGKVIERYGSSTKPESLRGDIEKLLDKNN